MACASLASSTFLVQPCMKVNARPQAARAAARLAPAQPAGKPGLAVLNKSSFAGTGLSFASKPVVQLRPKAQATVAAASGTKIRIVGKHLEVTDAIKGYVEEKMSNAISHYGEMVREVDIRLSVRTGGTGGHLQKAECTVFTKGGIVRAEEEAEILYASIDLVTDKIRQKLRKYKEKRDARRSSSARGSPHVADAVTDEVVVGSMVAASKPAALPKEVVRAKYYSMPPMSTQEALERMQDIDHDFYVFRNAETGELNVLYERTHGGYGVIVPKDA
eukprot:jgi/Mesvir1/22965/Mv15250-RA.1